MNRSLKILLIEPRNDEILTGSASTPPLWPSVLKALTTDEHQVDFVHCSFEELNDEGLAEYDLVGISVRTDTANHAYQLGDSCRRLGVLCVLGGIHPFVRPEETGRHCDSIVFGEAENAWPTVIEDARVGRLKVVYRFDRPTADQLVSPDCSVASKYQYPIANIIETVRGCPFNCSFCSATLYNGKRYRYKPIERVLAEIETWKNRSKLALFADLNIISSKRKAKDLLRELDGFGLMWWGNASVDVADDDELLRLLADSGCSYLGLGFESVSPATLDEM
ncbi:MAG: radical SAM protein, partial [Deltaproteobacteria bacterium]|nr:radical SAM protein [Deltaproteobacteria bacterium]